MSHTRGSARGASKKNIRRILNSNDIYDRYDEYYYDDLAEIGEDAGLDLRLRTGDDICRDLSLITSFSSYFSYMLIHIRQHLRSRRVVRQMIIDVQERASHFRVSLGHYMSVRS